MYAVPDEDGVAPSPSPRIEVGDKVRASSEKICVRVCGFWIRENWKEKDEREIRDLWERERERERDEGSEIQRVKFVG